MDKAQAIADLNRTLRLGAAISVSSLSERSLTPIDDADLVKLGEIAAEERSTFFSKNPRWVVYRNRIICVALCQGAALHFINKTNGIKDFDVWTFYAAYPGRAFPYRRIGNRDFCNPKFGRRSADSGYSGRRVDLIGRSIPYCLHANPVESLRPYLQSRATKSARLLAQKAVVLIEPAVLRGTII